jgi:hypothetical protein
MFEVTRREHVSTRVAEDFCYKVWIVEARSRSNAQTLLLRGSVQYAGHLKPKDKKREIRNQTWEEQISDI